eukprot:500334-Prymnesium_polylepis.1
MAAPKAAELFRKTTSSAWKDPPAVTKAGDSNHAVEGARGQPITVMLACGLDPSGLTVTENEPTSLHGFTPDHLHVLEQDLAGLICVHPSAI